MDGLWIILFLIVVFLVADKFFGISDKFKEFLKPPPEYPYCKKTLLTEHETEFYKKIKPLVDSYGLCILAKTRLADLVDVKSSEDKTSFSKIKSKHIDFVIAEPDDMTAECLIELDDSSHEAPERQELD